LSVVISQFGPESLAAYETIGIGYQIDSRVVLEALKSSAGAVIREVPITPRWKEYDLSVLDRPTNLHATWDISNWAIFGARRGDEWLGGAIVARDTPELDLLEGRTDLALIVDIRVRRDARGNHVGKALFEYGANWAKGKGCIELRVETQDVNVAACRFYAAMGCSLLSAEVGAYEGIDEAKLIWSIGL
jgi:GNAT superfamily N-acetyltransferase